MQRLTIKSLLDLSKTLMSGLFSNLLYPWEVLPKIHDFILEFGQSLKGEEFEEVFPTVWVSSNCKIDPSSSIMGPCIIDSGAEVRHCAFIRGNVIVGKNTVVGNSTELKNCVLFDNVQVPHFNYVGDSILGYKSHLGAGAILSNVKSNKTNVTIKFDNKQIETGLRKFGSILGDYVEIGCNAVLNPGSIIGKSTIIYPGSLVRGYVPRSTILKNLPNLNEVERY